MNKFATDEDRRLAEHLLKRSLRHLIKNYRNDQMCDQDIVQVINAYEHLYGPVEEC